MGPSDVVDAPLRLRHGAVQVRPAIPGIRKVQEKAWDALPPTGAPQPRDVGIAARSRAGRVLSAVHRAGQPGSTMLWRQAALEAHAAPVKCWPKASEPV